MQLDAINLARARCVLTFKRYIKKKTAPHLLGRIQVRARLALRLRLRFIENAIRSCLVNRKIDLLFTRPHLISALGTQERKSSHFLLFFTVHVNCTVH
jgi:hypothetical protein